MDYIISDEEIDDILNMIEEDEVDWRLRIREILIEDVRLRGKPA